MRLINESIIKSNIERLKEKNEIMLVVKDNAYGFGICRVVNIARQLGVNDYAVKNINEAIVVRTINKNANILLLGKSRKSWIEEIKKYKIMPTINDFDDYLLFKDHKIKSHLAIDIGMNRFGMKDGYLGIINDDIVDSIYVHVYSKESFSKIKEIEDLANKYNKKIHIGGSNIIGRTHNKIRVGRAIYQGALSLIGEIVNIKKIVNGESVGYDSYFSTTKEEIIGVCDIGYSNGLNLFFNGRVKINGNYYQCVGKCCMDQSFIIIDNNVKIGDKVEFFGREILEEEFLLHNNETRYEMYLNINSTKF